MLDNIVKLVVGFIVYELELKDENKIDRIRYGMETLIGEIFKLTIILIASLLINKGFEFVIVISLMTIIRSSIGGSHAKNIMRCLIKSITLFVLLYFLADKINRIGIIIEVISILIIIITLSTVRYKTKLDKNGTDKVKNNKLRGKLIFISMMYLIISKLFFYEYYSLVFITIVFIIIDYLNMEGFFMLNKFKVSKHIAKYVGMMSLAIATVALNNYSFIIYGEPELPNDIKNK